MLGMVLSVIAALHFSSIVEPPFSYGTAAASCPADNPSGREMSTRFLTREAYAADRAALGLSGVAPGSIRVLADATDPAACQWFAANLNPRLQPNWYWTAYQVGNHYFVGYRYQSPDGSLRLGLSPAYVYDKSYRQVLGITM
jgi:hypothetical protein